MWPGFLSCEGCGYEREGRLWTILTMFCPTRSRRPTGSHVNVKVLSALDALLWSRVCADRLVLDAVLLVRATRASRAQQACHTTRGALKSTSVFNP